jgi:hypothetical protein
MSTSSGGGKSHVLRELYARAVVHPKFKLFLSGHHQAYQHIVVGGQDAGSTSLHVEGGARQGAAPRVVGRVTSGRPAGRRAAPYWCVGPGTQRPFSHSSPPPHWSLAVQGWRSTTVAHWAMWLPLPSSWNGSQNAG